MQLSLTLDPVADATLIERLFDMFEVEDEVRADPVAAANALSLLTRHAFELLASGALDAAEEPATPADMQTAQNGSRPALDPAAVEAALLDLAGAEHRSEIVDDGRGDPVMILAQDSDFVPLGKAHAAQIELELRLSAVFELLARSASAKRLLAVRRLTTDNNSIDEMVLHDIGGPIEVIADFNGVPHRFRIDATGALVVGSLTEPPTPLQQ